MTDGHYILVVDDDLQMREAIGEVLVSEGYSVCTARDGREALDVLHARPGACLIFLDLMMPVMDGWEFRSFQQREPALAAIPVCVVSAAGPSATKDLGGARLLSKPVRAEALIEAAAEFC